MLINVKGRLLEIKSGVSKKGNDYVTVRFVDVASYESYTMFVNDPALIEGLVQGKDYVFRLRLVGGFAPRVQLDDILR